MINSTRDNSFTKTFTLQNFLVLLILVSIVLAQLSLLLPSHQSLTGRDSGIFLYIGKIILEGKTPYLDVWENKGPLIFYINAFGLLIGSGSRWGVWFVELVFLFFAVYLGFKITKRFFGLPSAILSTIIWVLSLSRVSQGGNLTEQYSLLFSFVGIACYLWGAEKTQMRRFDFLLGLSFGLNFLLRPNNIGTHLAIVFSLLFFLWFENNWKLLSQRILYMSFGGLTITLPFVIYFIKVDALNELYKIVFLFNTQYSSDFSINQITKSFVQGYSYFDVWVMMLTISGYLWVLLKFIIQPNKKGFDAKLYVFLLLYWPLEIILSSLSGRNYPHYFIPWVPVICLLSAHLFKEISKNNHFLRKTSNAFLVALLFTTLVITQKNLTNYIPVLTSLSTGKTLASTEYIHPAAKYVQENTQENEKVLVWGFRPIINVMADRESPSMYLPYPAMHEDTELSYKWAEQFYAQLQSNPPVFIIDMVDITDDAIPSLDLHTRNKQNINTEWVIAHNIDDVYEYIETKYSYETNVAGRMIYKLRK